MTAKADKNPNAGIEQLFTGLLPDADAHAFQTPPESASRPSWRVVSSDGSRSEAGPFRDTSCPPNSPSAETTDEITASKAGLLEQVLSTPGDEKQPRHIDPPQANTDVAELARACGFQTTGSGNGKGPRAESTPAGLGPGSQCESPDETAEPAGAPPAGRTEESAIPPSTLASADRENSTHGAIAPDPRARSDENYELARVVRSWGKLPPNIRGAILAIIDSL